MLFVGRQDRSQALRRIRQFGERGSAFLLVETGDQPRDRQRASEAGGNKGPIRRHLIWTYTGPPPRAIADKPG